MKRLFVPLFWKFSLAIIAVVAVFGSINIYLIWDRVYTALQRESQKRGIYISRSLARQVVDPLLYEDYVTAQNLLMSIQSIDSTIAYAFVVAPLNKVVLHTFEDGFPHQLLQVNAGSPGDSVRMQFVVPKNAPEVLIRDIAVPILNGKLGTLRVGIREEALRAQVNHTVQVFLIMVGVFLTIGLVGAFAFARFINAPVQEISRIADRLDFDVLRQRSQPRIRIREKLLGLVRVPWRAEDELDVLADKFNGMIIRLENAYAELQRANASLVQSEKLASVGTLAAGIAHEINNPIAGLQNCIRRIRRNPQNMRQNEKYLAMMDEAIGKIERVVKGLLEYTRKEEMDFTELNIQEVVEKALLLVAYHLEKSRVTVTKEFPPRLPVIQGSFNHLEQVIVNLLLNSIYAIRERRREDPHCPAKIVLSAAMENGRLRLSVKDTGTGISPEHLRKVFDPFFTTKGVGEGTGLGLSVCYKIIQAHRGTIRVSSRVNQGTEVIIHLPVASKAEQPTVFSTGETSSSSTQVTNSGNKT